jgi:Zn-dependent peptidase ImmA (M78 family)
MSDIDSLDVDCLGVEIVLEADLRGELCLADMPQGREREKRANRFAGALMMPAERFRDELRPPVMLYDFGKAKRRFGISMQAAIVRHFLG